MSHHDPQQNIGGLVISNEVLAAIAVAAARDTEGVSALLPHPQPIWRRGESLRYVKIGGTAAELVFDMTLRVRADAKVCAVACDVQRAVKNAVQGMTGKTVARVNLRIDGADF